MFQREPDVGELWVEKSSGRTVAVVKADDIAVIVQSEGWSVPVTYYRTEFRNLFREAPPSVWRKPGPKVNPGQVWKDRFTGTMVEAITPMSSGGWVVKCEVGPGRWIDGFCHETLFGARYDLVSPIAATTTETKIEVGQVWRFTGHKDEFNIVSVDDANGLVELWRTGDAVPVPYPKGDLGRYFTKVRDARPKIAAASGPVTCRKCEQTNEFAVSDRGDSTYLCCGCRMGF